jgi:polyphenol oxidase
MMNFPHLPFAFQDHPLGHCHEESDLSVFFGNKLSLPEAVHSAFPDFQLVILRQTHSDIVVKSPFSGSEPPEADAHITKSRRVALCVRTADCIPVFIHDPSSGFIAGIHAGWRGIENEIIRKTADRLTREGAHLERARAWIGPHIGATNFEVGHDVGARLEARLDAVRGHTSETTALRPHEDPQKVRVDLLAIARAQLHAAGIGSERILELAIDTHRSSQHESYRRDRTAAGRQLSFIALK